MAIISANIQYNRGEHELLDYSSLRTNYTDALEWARDPYSNAAVGQFIYLQEPETINENIYVKGPYIVEEIGRNPVITPLIAPINNMFLKREKIEGKNYVILYGDNNAEISRVLIDDTSIDAGEY